uniref:COMM domain-containing protein 3 n=1 Tax=Glossina brevipalpis TaxID=37001 RepID=A0A1A9WIE5_9MUSC
MDTENKNNVILSSLVVNGLKLLCSAMPLDLTRKLILNCVKLALQPEATIIPPVPEIYLKNSGEAKQSEYAVITLFALATKHALDNLSLRQLLEDQQLSQVIIEELVRTYEEHRQDFVMRQLNLGHYLPNITDVQWRIMADVKSSTSSQSSGEVGFHINLGYYHPHSGDRESVVDFICNTEEVQLLINKLKDVERQYEKLAKE